MRRQTLFLLLIILLLPAALCTEDPSPEDIYFQDWTFQVDDQEGKLEHLEVLRLRPDEDYKDFILLLNVTVKDEENRPKSYVVAKYKDYSQRLDYVSAVKSFEVDSDNGIAYIGVNYGQTTIFLYQFNYLEQKLVRFNFFSFSSYNHLNKVELRENGSMLLFINTLYHRYLCLFDLSEKTNRCISPTDLNVGFVTLRDSKVLISRNIPDNGYHTYGLQIVNFEIESSFMMKIRNPFKNKTSTLLMNGLYHKSNADYVHLFLRSATRIMYYKITSELFVSSIDSCVRFELDYKMQDKDFELIGKDDDIYLLLNSLKDDSKIMLVFNTLYAEYTSFKISTQRFVYYLDRSNIFHFLSSDSSLPSESGNTYKAIYSRAPLISIGSIEEIGVFSEMQIKLHNETIPDSNYEEVPLVLNDNINFSSSPYENAFAISLNLTSDKTYFSKSIYLKPSFIKIYNHNILHMKTTHNLDLSNKYNIYFPGNDSSGFVLNDYNSTREKSLWIRSKNVVKNEVYKGSFKFEENLTNQKKYTLEQPIVILQESCAKGCIYCPDYQEVYEKHIPISCNKCDEEGGYLKNGGVCYFTLLTLLKLCPYIIISMLTVLWCLSWIPKYHHYFKIYVYHCHSIFIILLNIYHYFYYLYRDHPTKEIEELLKVLAFNSTFLVYIFPPLGFIPPVKTMLLSYIFRIYGYFRICVGCIIINYFQVFLFLGSITLFILTYYVVFKNKPQLRRRIKYIFHCIFHYNSTINLNSILFYLEGVFPVLIFAFTALVIFIKNIYKVMKVQYSGQNKIFNESPYTVGLKTNSSYCLLFYHFFEIKLLLQVSLCLLFRKFIYLNFCIPFIVIEFLWTVFVIVKNPTVDKYLHKLLIMDCLVILFASIIIGIVIDKEGGYYFWKMDIIAIICLPINYVLLFMFLLMRMVWRYFSNRRNIKKFGRKEGLNDGEIHFRNQFEPEERRRIINITTDSHSYS
ncbi:unnamed protein product [Moneuplotes crassus]|uniref:Uncharacterized protein n=1 Tax=Euplotes crassus TaxID=5936 RepID=A0AAD1Y086_EUPCR|nr:unnamed protein product [Moneuplotes crassus]